MGWLAIPVGSGEGPGVGSSVSSGVGPGVGSGVGPGVGLDEGMAVGLDDGMAVGLDDGMAVVGLDVFSALEPSLLALELRLLPLALEFLLGFV